KERERDGGCMKERETDREMEGVGEKEGERMRVHERKTNRGRKMEREGERERERERERREEERFRSQFFQSYLFVWLHNRDCYVWLQACTRHPSPSCVATRLISTLLYRIL